MKKMQGSKCGWRNKEDQGVRPGASITQRTPKSYRRSPDKSFHPDAPVYTKVTLFPSYRYSESIIYRLCGELTDLGDASGTLL